MVLKQYSIEAKSFDDDNLTLTAIISTEAVDRDGEIVKQAGLNVDNFLKNPVVLKQHNSFGNPVGRVVSINKQPTKTEATIQFADKDTNPEGYQTYKMFKGGFFKAFSIGFKTINSYMDGDVRVIDESELLEVSAVAIPANSEATVKNSQRSGQNDHIKSLDDLKKHFLEYLDELANKNI